jgi:uncharacterized protein (DUF1684 family)
MMRIRRGLEKGFVGIAGVLVFLLAGSAAAQKNYKGDIEKWRQEHEAGLKKDNGWLTVVGLFWLKEGTNTVGSSKSSSGYDIDLPEGMFWRDDLLYIDHAKVGEIQLHDGKATLTVEPEFGATSNDEPFTRVELVSDEFGKQNIIKIGSVSFYLIDREKRFGIRVKDNDSPARKGFTHLDWYKIDSKYRVTATFERYAIPKEVLIPNILGGTFKMKAPGLLKFKLNGRSVILEPVVEEGEEDTLFIIFRDQTSRTTTYAAGRFLYADMPKGDTAILDFNKAENPPCAFTTFATCPLPPQQNRLDIAIPAGEKRYAHAAKH